MLNVYIWLEAMISNIGDLKRVFDLIEPQLLNYKHSYMPKFIIERNIPEAGNPPNLACSKIISSLVAI